MILDEAIYREEATAYAYGERWKRLGEPIGNLPELEAEHKQYAEWLRELKAYREAREEIQRKANSGQWSDAVIYGLSKATVIIDKCLFAHNVKEVNADECNL